MSTTTTTTTTELTMQEKTIKANGWLVENLTHIMNHLIAEGKHDMHGLTTETAVTAFKGAFSSRGRTKGMLKANCPNSSHSNRLARACWQAAMLTANPYKVSIFSSVICRSDKQEKLLHQIVHEMCARSPKMIQFLDRDRRNLESMGVW